MSHRTPSIIPFVLLLALACCLAGCGAGAKWHSSTFLFFDTVCEVRLYASKADFLSAQEDIQQIFTEINARFSPDSEDLASPDVLALFQRAAEFNTNSEGLFDITVGPLSEIWGFRDEAYRIPSPETLEDTLALVGMDKIDEESRALVLLPGMELDWGGIAKGYGIDLASQALMGRGIPSGFLNAGGDLFCWGKNPEETPWKIGIKHPRQNGILGILDISGMGAATAGDYQRFFLQDGIRYHHIFDPKTGLPARGKQSVTVVGPETLVCDALSTALFVSDRPEAILEKYPQYGAVIMDEDGSIRLLGKSFPFHPSE